MLTNTQTLQDIGIKLLEPLRQVKAHHKMKCIACNYEWTATPLSKIQNYKRYGRSGCPECWNKNQEADYEVKRTQFIKKIEDKGFTILSAYDGKQSYLTKIQVRNNTCGHEFDVDPRNLGNKTINCPICNKAEKIKRLNANSKARSVEWQKTADIWDQYRHKVYMATRSTYRKHFAIINPLNLPRGLAGEEGAYHLDHIVPVRWCFEHYVPPKLCADVTNLQMMDWHSNIGSRDHLKEGTKIPEIFTPYLSKT